jgi:hypothetical protein
MKAIGGGSRLSLTFDPARKGTEADTNIERAYRRVFV